jgi:hypothetical protein
MSREIDGFITKGLLRLCITRVPLIRYKDYLGAKHAVLSPTSYLSISPLPAVLAGELRVVGAKLLVSNSRLFSYNSRPLCQLFETPAIAETKRGHFQIECRLLSLSRKAISNNTGDLANIERVTQVYKTNPSVLNTHHRCPALR